MSFERGGEGGPADPLSGRPRLQHVRRDVRVGALGLATIACPRCDAPVALPRRAVAPTDSMECPYCAYLGRVRDFLTLAAPGSPARPTRVRVRVSAPGRLHLEDA